MKIVIIYIPSMSFLNSSLEYQINKQTTNKNGEVQRAWTQTFFKIVSVMFLKVRHIAIT